MILIGRLALRRLSLFPRKLHNCEPFLIRRKGQKFRRFENYGISSKKLLVCWSSNLKKGWTKHLASRLRLPDNPCKRHRRWLLQRRRHKSLSNLSPRSPWWLAALVELFTLLTVHQVAAQQPSQRLEQRIGPFQFLWLTKRVPGTSIPRRASRKSSSAGFGRNETGTIDTLRTERLQTHKRNTRANLAMET
jgi:hypothetical protein